MYVHITPEMEVPFNTIGQLLKPLLSGATQRRAPAASLPAVFELQATEVDRPAQMARGARSGSCCPIGGPDVLSNSRSDRPPSHT